MHDVFISYSSKDAKTMQLISHTFEANGIHCWYAPRDIAPGLDWREAIIDAISASKVFILVYSRYSNQSRQVLNEVTAAFNASCVIIPFRIDDDQMAPALSYYLNNLHWMDAMSLPRNNKVDELCSMVKGILGEKPEPSEEPVPSPVPKKGKILPVLLAVILVAAIVIFCVSAFGDAESTVPFSEDSTAIETAYDSVVTVNTYYWGNHISRTCGFACFADNIIVTYDCVPDAYLSEVLGSDIGNYGADQGFQISITTEAGVTLIVREILALDQELGIAILSTSGSHGLSLLQTNPLDTLQRGDKLTALAPHLAIGEYLGHEVLGANESIVFSELLEIGSAGSALMNADGKVIGMTYAQDDRFCYAIPMEQIQHVWDSCTDNTK